MNSPRRGAACSGKWEVGKYLLFVKDSVTDGEKSQLHIKFQYFIAIEVARSSLPKSELDSIKNISAHPVNCVSQQSNDPVTGSLCLALCASRQSV